MKSKKVRRTTAEGGDAQMKKSEPEAEAAGDERPGEMRETIASQTRTTRKLDEAVKRDADQRMAGGDKAAERWEGEGGSIPSAKKGRKR